MALVVQLCGRRTAVMSPEARERRAASRDSQRCQFLRSGKLERTRIGMDIA
jgi:hypothetical protein